MPETANTEGETDPSSVCGVRVSIVIPCRNEARHIEACLASVLAQEAPEGGFEVIIADGISDDGTKEILEKLASKEARLRVIENPQRIVSTGLNAGIRAARGEIIIRMDAHSEYAPDYVRQCVAALEESSADNAGGPWVAKGKGLVSEAIAAAFESSFAVGGGRAHSPNFEGWVDTVYLGCWWKKVFSRYSGFDEDLVRNQDDEHNLRIVRGGGRIWQSPKIKSWYCPRGSLGALFRQYSQYGYWKIRVIQKHRLPASLRHLVPGAFMIALFGCAVGSMVWKPLWWALVWISGLYSAGVLWASLVTAAKKGWKLLPILPAVFCCYHFGYGWGFLRGVLDFVVLKRGAGASFVQITRPSESTAAVGEGLRGLTTPSMSEQRH